ncbi:MAG: DMT family protein [Bacteroidetes bacterium]|nr:DMT family protein [Bacteroidota bacterium]
MRNLFTVILLVSSNVFMTLAWYGHLKWKSHPLLLKYGMAGIFLFSWGLAFFEYLLQVPANRLGSRETGGTMDLFQLKILQEVISIAVFTILALFVFQGEAFHWRYGVAFVLILAAVWLVFGMKNG